MVVNAPIESRNARPADHPVRVNGGFVSRRAVPWARAYAADGRAAWPLQRSVDRRQPNVNEFEGKRADAIE